MEPEQGTLRRITASPPPNMSPSMHRLAETDARRLHRIIYRHTHQECIETTVCVGEGSCSRDSNGRPASWFEQVDKRAIDTKMHHDGHCQATGGSFHTPWAETQYSTIFRIRLKLFPARRRTLRGKHSATPRAEATVPWACLRPVKPCERSFIGDPRKNRWTPPHQAVSRSVLSTIKP